MPELSDFVRAPSQADDPGLYEVGNADRPGRSARRRVVVRRTVDERDALDLGCGSGYWLPTYQHRARSVLGVEPARSLLPLAAARESSVRVLHGSAEHIPLPDAFGI